MDDIIAELRVLPAKILPKKKPKQFQVQRLLNYDLSSFLVSFFFFFGLNDKCNCISCKIT